MNCRELTIGKRYKLPHGIGTLVGFELFYANGMKSKVVTDAPEYGNPRCVFKLDDGHTWVSSSEHYCAWDDQIEEV